MLGVITFFILLFDGLCTRWIITVLQSQPICLIRETANVSDKFFEIFFRCYFAISISKYAEIESTFFNCFFFIYPMAYTYNGIEFKLLPQAKISFQFAPRIRYFTFIKKNWNSFVPKYN